MIVEGKIVDISKRRIYSGALMIEKGRIKDIIEKPNTGEHFILPGFIDAHVHIESSMLVPSEFARIAVKHGTVATVSDPHEIANVLGLRGVEFMIDNGNTVPFKFNFGAPSCVPATSFETSGASIDSEGISKLLRHPEIRYLAEMMNYPGVIHGDPEVEKKIEWAKLYNKPIDGHAPGLCGPDLDSYISAGITTDHECFSYHEALEKLQKGMHILIREGSAAKNFDALINLLPQYYQKLMFCSDDKHPDELLRGHINELVVRAVSRGFDLFQILQIACINPIEHYNLDVGRLRIGDAADFIVVKDLRDFELIQTVIQGELVFKDGYSLIDPVPFKVLNNFKTELKMPSDFKCSSEAAEIKVIECIDNELITNKIIAKAKLVNGFMESDTSQDILKITVVNRYQNKPPALAFIKNFGLKKGAIASSVAHDSHNIVAIGVNDKALCRAVNLIIKERGGIAAVSLAQEKVMPLPVAGIMSTQDGEITARAYSELDQLAKTLGSSLSAPYMTLSFMALLVIPSLKLSDKGLFDGTLFELTDLKGS